LQREPATGVRNIENYAPELEAIDVAVLKTIATHPGKITISPFGWGEPASPGSGTFKAVGRPIVPVVADDQAKLTIAVLQRLYLCRRAMFFEKDPDLGVFYVLLAMADRLMSRKMILSASTAHDLVEVLRKTCEYLSQPMTHIERSFSPPVPAKLRSPLKRLQAKLSTPVKKCSWKPRSPMIVPKRNQNMCQRIERLLGK
jgi:hypothetical protein